MDKKAERGKEGSDDLSKQSLNGMLGPGDVNYDEEGFVVEQAKERSERYFRQYHNENTKEEITYEEAMEKLGRSFKVPEMLDLANGVYTQWARYWMEVSE